MQLFASNQRVLAGLSDQRRVRVNFVEASRPTRQRDRLEDLNMCRNIKTLFNFSPPVTEDEIHAAALQFVRKVSGFQKPSRANEAAFQAAVEDIAAICSNLLGRLETSAPPRYREVEAVKARERSLRRFAP